MIELFVPGRVCLFGEHSDWAGGYRKANPGIKKGYTLICGTDQGIYARASAHPESLILSSRSPEGRTIGPVTIPMVAEQLLKLARKGGFWSYVAGAAYQVQSRHAVRGLTIYNYRTDLPVRRGLSSSAAICVLTIRAFNQLYDLGLGIAEEMELAYLGEITTPSQCGRMDQGCAYGRQPVLMIFDGDHVETMNVRVGKPLHMLLVDLGMGKNTTKILADLNKCYPEAENDVARGVQRLLGPLNKDMVARAVAALESGEPRRLGRLMTEAQTLFDRYAVPACPDELGAPVLHRVLAYGPLQNHVWGGKGVGSQGDGAVQFVARSAEDREAAADIVERELGMHCLPLTIAG